MTSPNRSVVVRLALDPSSYVAGAARAEASTLSLDRAVSKVGPSSATSMEQAAKGAGTAEGALGKLNKTAGALGFTLGGLAGVGAGISAALSVKWAGDYQQALTKLATTAGESQKNLGRVGQGMLDMAGQVGIGADELAKGMYTVESAGIHGADALTVLKAAAQGARQENADLGHVTDAVTTALHDYNLPASDAAKVTSQLVTAVSHGKTTFDELTGAMHSVTPLAAALHVPLADVAGVLSSMTASGESADQAAQNMADTLRHLQNPTSTMTSELAQLGITSSDLSTQLSTRGLSGTLQGISEAILTKIDPATQKVLLPAFNQSKTAAQDLNIMIGHMPPALAKLSQSLLDGATTQGEYRKAAQALGGQAGVLGDNFLSLYKTSDGFNNIIKAGGPAAQVYTAALQKAVGTSAGLTVALQVTGEHAAATNAAIKDIAHSAGDASGNIKGWDEVQGNFNQQVAQAEAHLKSMAIEAGQHLLPALTGAFGYVNRDVLPALEHLGSAVGDAAHWFSELPAPIKDTAYALAALALAEKIGLIDRLGGSLAGLRSGFGGLRSEIALTQALTGGAEAGLGKLGATAEVVAARGLNAVKAAGSGVVDMLGGPWTLATAAAGAGIYGLVKAFTAANDEIQANTRYLLDNMKAEGQVGEQGQEAAQRVADFEGHIKNLTAAISNMQEAASSPTNTAGLGRFGNQLEVNKNSADDLRTALDQAKLKYQEYLNSLSPVERAQAMVAKATNDLNVALRDAGPNSDAVTSASGRLQSAQALLASAQQQANDATKTHLQLLQQQATSELASVSSTLAAQQAQLSFNQALDQYNADAKDGQHSSAQLAQEQNSLAQSAISAAQAAGQQAADQAKANGVTDTANISNQAMLVSLQQVAKQMGTNTPAAISQAIAALSGATVQAGSLTDAIGKMGLQNGIASDRFRQEWGNNAVVLKGVTDAQVKDLQGLGYTVNTLPNHQILVSADTRTARNAITQLTNDYAQYSINVGVKLGAGHFAAADGGILPGFTPGRDVHQFISPTGGSLALSGGEAIMRPEFTAAVGSGWVNSMNATARSGGTAGVRSALGFADGGIFDMFLTANVGISPSSYNAAEASIRQMVDAAAAAFAPAAPGAPSSVQGNAAIVQAMAAARGWTGAEWNALYSLVMRESGFRNTAQNPTSTAYGMFQFLNSTWAGYGLSKTSDPAAQTRAGLDYIRGRYGDPLGAWGHETRYGWYDGGGQLMPGATLALNGTGRPETVRTAEQEQTVQRALRTREFGGSGGVGMVVHNNTKNVNYTVPAPGPTTEQTVRALRDFQYQQDYLNG